MTFRTASFLALAFVVVLIAGLAFSLRPPGGLPRPITQTLSRYNNAVFGVSLDYPASWQPDFRYASIEGISNRYEGSGGFFGVDALTENENGSINDAAKNFAYHEGKPYGSSPVIEQAVVDGREARLVIPSSDQPDVMRRESVLVVRYRAPVTIGKTTYGYLVLYADRSHLRTLAESVRLTR